MIWLIKYLPQRWHSYVLDRFWLIPAGLFFVACFGGVVYLTIPSPFTSAGYVMARVLSGMDTSTDHGFRYRFVGELQDGTLVTFGTRSPALAATAAQSACLERRQHASGRVSYVLVRPERCTR